MSIIANFEVFPEPGPSTPDYKAIYKYISGMLSESELPDLGKLESAVILDLLHGLVDFLRSHHTTKQREVMLWKYNLLAGKVDMNDPLQALIKPGKLLKMISLISAQKMGIVSLSLPLHNLLPRALLKITQVLLPNQHKTASNQLPNQHKKASNQIHKLTQNLVLLRKSLAAYRLQKNVTWEKKEQKPLKLPVPGNPLCLL